MSSQPPTAAVCPTGPNSAASDPGEEMIYAISHDLRGPLLNFQGFLRRLRNGCELVWSQAEQWDLTPEQRSFSKQILEQKVWSSLEVLDQNARLMERLLAALLALSRAGREPARVERVSTDELVRAVAQEFRAASAEKNATLTLRPLPDLWADTARLEDIFRHLLSNALKFLSPDRAGLITLGGEVRGSEVVCWVRDNGIGIKPQNQDRIFLPFGRVREIEAPGEGVGLATVRKLVQQQGGRVWVESTHRQGSTFYLGFPTPP